MRKFWPADGTARTMALVVATSAALWSAPSAAMMDSLTFGKLVGERCRIQFIEPAKPELERLIHDNDQPGIKRWREEMTRRCREVEYDTHVEVFGRPPLNRRGEP